MFKKIFIILIATFIFAQYLGVSHGAGSDSSSDSGSDNYMDQYKTAKQFISRAEKLEKKDKIDRATKLYAKALDKLKEAHKQDRNNPDILNYLGLTLGKFEEAEKHYLAGLKIKPNHNGINEYLGELYVKTGRVELAKERLAVLKNCNCEEYAELKEVIEKN